MVFVVFRLFFEVCLFIIFIALSKCKMFLMFEVVEWSICVVVRLVIQ